MVGVQHVEPLLWDECMRDGVYLFEIVTGDREFEDHAVVVMTR